MKFELFAVCFCR